MSEPAKYRPLGEVADIQYGWTAKASPEVDGPRMLRITDIQDGRVDWQGVPRCEMPENKRSLFRLHAGDIVFARIGATTGKSYLIGPDVPDAVFASYLIRVRPVEGLRSDFLAHFFQSAEYWAHIRRESRGIGRPAVNGKLLSRLLVPILPLSEQDRIIAGLERLLARIANGARNIGQARARGQFYRRSVLHESLGNCFRVNADSPGLPELPEDWVWSTVAEEGTAQLGRMLNKERSSGSHMRPYLRVANVMDDRLDLSDVKEMDFPPDEYERYRLEPGDILLNEGQSPELLGRPAMYRGEMPGVCFQKTLLRFKAGPRVDPEFALLVFRHYLHSGRFRQESRITTGIGHLTGVRFAKMEFPVPPLARQRELVSRIRRQLGAADSLDASLGLVEHDANVLRASVLKDAFSGRLAAANEVREPAAPRDSSQLDASKRSNSTTNSARAVPGGS